MLHASSQTLPRRSLALIKILRYWLPPMAWAILIGLASSDLFYGGWTYRWVRAVLIVFFPGLSPVLINLIHLGVRKTAHVLEYCIFTLLLYRAFSREAVDGRRWHWAYWSASVALAMAGFDELHQMFTTRRTGSILDVSLDAVGVVLAQALVWYRYHCRSLRPLQ